MNSEVGLFVVWPQSRSSTKWLEGLAWDVPGLRGRQLSWGRLVFLRIALVKGGTLPADVSGAWVILHTGGRGGGG